MSAAEVLIPVPRRPTRFLLTADRLGEFAEPRGDRQRSGDMHFESTINVLPSTESAAFEVPNAWPFIFGTVNVWWSSSRQPLLLLRDADRQRRRSGPPHPVVTPPGQWNREPRRRGSALQLLQAGLRPCDRAPRALAGGAVRAKRRRLTRSRRDREPARLGASPGADVCCSRRDLSPPAARREALASREELRGSQVGDPRGGLRAELSGGLRGAENAPHVETFGGSGITTSSISVDGKVVRTGNSGDVVGHC